MQRLLCRLSWCVRALHFFGLRCLLSNAGSAAVTQTCRCSLVRSFLLALHTHTNTHTGHRIWIGCPGVTAKQTFFFFIYLLFRKNLGAASVVQAMVDHSSQLLSTHFHHGRTEHGQMRVFCQVTHHLFQPRTNVKLSSFTVLIWWVATCILFHGHCDMPNWNWGNFLALMAGAYFVWSCARVAGSDCVRTCNGETRALAMVSFNLYANQQWP